MKTTHTPGPWYPERPYSEDGVYVASAATSALVCKLNKVDGRFYRDAQESIDANARLIASAPDLLAALEECITSEGAACFGDMENHPEWMQRRLYAISDIARATIAKAKGQE